VNRTAQVEAVGEHGAVPRRCLMDRRKDSLMPDINDDGLPGGDSRGEALFRTPHGLSAFCRGLEDLGYDTLWVGDR
jgi:hypothetical protein